MTPQDLAEIVYNNLEPEDTAQFAIAMKSRIMNGDGEAAKLIADQLESVGITIAGIPCKAHPA